MLLEKIKNKKDLQRYTALVFMGCLLISVASFLLWDQAVSNYFHQPELIPLWLFAREITNIGLSEHYFVFTIILFIGLKWFTPHVRKLDLHQKKVMRLTNWSISFFTSLIYTGIGVHLVKVLFGRQRPHISETFVADMFYPLNWHWDYQSFPSGHSQVMFVVATMMAILIPRAQWFFYLFALCIVATRVIIHDHFISDVIMGSCLGYLGTLWTLFYLQKKRPLN